MSHRRVGFGSIAGSIVFWSWSLALAGTQTAELPNALDASAVAAVALEGSATPTNYLQEPDGPSADDGQASMENRIAELESALKKQDETIAEMKKAQGSFVRMGHGEESFGIFGRIHLDYWAFPGVDDELFSLEGGDPQDRFLFRRLRLGAKGNIDDNMLYNIEMEFAEGVDPSFRDAYLGFEHLPILKTVLLGNQKRPYGLDHLNSSRYNVFIERPLAIEAFNQDTRRLGVTSNGFSEDERYNWRYGVYNMRNIQGLGSYLNDNYQLELAGRLASTPWYDESSGGRGYAHFAVSGSVGFPDGLTNVQNEARYRTRPEARTTLRWLDTGVIQGAETMGLMGFENVWNFGPLQFCGEYQFTSVTRSAGFGDQLNFNGGYAYVAYFLTGEHIPWDRKRGVLERVKPFENFFCIRDCEGCRQKGIGAWQVALRYSHLDLTNEDIEGGIGDALTVGLNWHWNPYARMQFNYLFGDLDRGPGDSGEYHIVGTRFMVDF